MSLQITISAAKKLPHPTHQFGSISAQVSLVGEAATLADAPTIMRDLFAAAQAGCDQHLAQQSNVNQSPAPLPVQQPRQPAMSPSTTPGRSSAPYRPTGTAQRRGPAPVTDSQLRFLDRLLTQTQSSLPDILDQHQVASLRDLSCKAAAGLIDSLKAQVAA